MGVGERVYSIDYYRKKYDDEMEWIRQVILATGNLNRTMEENINILLKDNKELRDELEFMRKESKGLVEQILEYEKKRDDLIKENLDLKKDNLDLKKDLGKELVDEFEEREKDENSD